MTREQLHERVKAAMAHEFASREAHKDWPYEQRARMAGMYADIGSNLFMYELLDTPGVLEAVLKYVK